MFLKRFLQLPENHSFFLLGPRGVGKSTLVRKQFDHDACIIFDLLEAKYEEKFSRNPDELKDIVLALPKEKTHIIIDEVQKIPKLLDIVHQLIESTDKVFYFNRIKRS